jgi:hypothetical protein
MPPPPSPLPPAVVNTKKGAAVPIRRNKITAGEPGVPFVLNANDYTGNANPQYIVPKYNLDVKAPYVNFIVDGEYYRVYGQPKNSNSAMIEYVSKFVDQKVGSTTKDAILLNLQRELVKYETMLPELKNSVNKYTQLIAKSKNGYSDVYSLEMDRTMKFANMVQLRINDIRREIAKIKTVPVPTNIPVPYPAAGGEMVAGPVVAAPVVAVPVVAAPVVAAPVAAAPPAAAGSLPPPPLPPADEEEEEGNIPPPPPPPQLPMGGGARKTSKLRHTRGRKTRGRKH